MLANHCSRGRRCVICRVMVVAMLIVALTSPAGASNSGQCDEFAGATLRFIVPNKPGGGYDAYARLLQPFFEKRLDANIIIDNRPQAGGIVGATAIRDAKPDGMTIGIINASGLLAATPDGRAPNPATDYTVLGRVISNHSVMLTGQNSGIGSLNQLLRVAKERPIVIGVRDAGSASLFAIPVTAAMLEIDYELVTGYIGNTARALAAIRGEVDVLIQNFDSTRRFIEAGELRPLLQLTEGLNATDAATDYALLSSVPVLGGVNGIAHNIAVKAGGSGELALKQARALVALINAGRLIVAPPTLPLNLRRCLEVAVTDVLRSAELQTAAQRVQLRIEPADAAAALADISIAAQSMSEFAPLVRAAMHRAKQ